MFLFVYLLAFLFVVVLAIVAIRLFLSPKANEALDNFAEKVVDADLDGRINTVVRERDNIRKDVLTEEERVNQLKEKT